MKKIILIAIVASIFTSCSKKGSENSNESDKKNETQVEECTYEVQNAFTKLEWEAYKTSAKIGVRGSFDDISIQAGPDNSSISGIATGLTFNLAVGSTNSNNEERDPKIIEYFFGKMLNTQFISGEIKSLNISDTATQAIVSIKMNDISKDIIADYSVNGNDVSLDCVLDLAQWSAEDAVASLNEVCKELHTGEDGVSKLWPEVKVTVTSTLKKNCPDASKP